MPIQTRINTKDANNPEKQKDTPNTPQKYHNTNWIRHPHTQHRNQKNQPKSQLMIDRILVRWERNFDMVIPTLVNCEWPNPTTTYVREAQTYEKETNTNHYNPNQKQANCIRNTKTKTPNIKTTNHLIPNLIHINNHHICKTKTKNEKSK